MKGFELYQPRTYLSISALTSFARCPRRFFYSSGVRLGRLGGDHIALTYGEAIHKALGVVLRSWDVQDAIINGFDKVWSADLEAVGDEMRNRGNAAITIARYVATHSGGRSIYQMVDPPKTGIVVSDKTSDYEIPFAINIPGLAVPLVGRIDGLCRHRDNGQLWGLEFKTTRELSTRFLDAFKRSPQVIAYTIALRVYHPQEPVVGCFVEGFRSSKKDPGESQLVPVMVNDQHIEAFLGWVRWKGNELLAMEQRQDFPMDYSACNPYPQHGMVGYDCDYGRLCEVHDWTSLKATYTIRTEAPFVIPNTPITVGGKEVANAETERLCVTQTLEAS